MADVNELIKEYRNETYIATTSFYAWRQVNNLASTDVQIKQALQQNALSWNLIRYSLQSTFFVALGRLFDKDTRSLTAQGFIARCRTEIKQFSKTALEERRVKGAGGAQPDWLDGFLVDVYEPVAADFDKLIGAADRYGELYRKTFEPIRHKVFAHKDFNTIDSKNALFENTTIAQAEDILRFLRQVVCVVNELYQDGRLTELGDYVKDLKKLESEVHSDVEALLRKTTAGK